MILCLVLSGQVRASFGASISPKLSRPCKVPLKTRLGVWDFRVSYLSCCAALILNPSPISAGEGGGTLRKKAFCSLSISVLKLHSLAWRERNQEQRSGTSAVCSLCSEPKTSNVRGGLPLAGSPLDTAPAASQRGRCHRPPRLPPAPLCFPREQKNISALYPLCRLDSRVIEKITEQGLLISALATMTTLRPFSRTAYTNLSLSQNGWFSSAFLWLVLSAQ